MKKANYIVLVICVLISGCYSFRGGSLPEHIKTIQIRNIVDNSNYGDPTYKEYFFNKINEVIRKDNSLSIETNPADSKLSIIIQSIKEDVVSTSAASGLEKERKIVVSVGFEFYDNIKKQLIAQNNSLSMTQQFSIQNVPSSRNEAVRKCLDILADEILNNMIAGE